MVLSPLIEGLFEAVLDILFWRNPRLALVAVVVIVIATAVIIWRSG